jgi:multicomponent Na+:H+ antiporter subunit C
MTLALSAGVLVAGAVYLMLQRGMLRIVLGFVLLSHAVNLMIMAAGGSSRRGEPLGADPDPAITADPLPQAFVLTAIVIAFAITIFMLSLAVAGRGDDDTDDLLPVHSQPDMDVDADASASEAPRTDDNPAETLDEFASEREVKDA